MSSVCAGRRRWATARTKKRPGRAGALFRRHLDIGCLAVKRFAGKPTRPPGDGGNIMDSKPGRLTGRGIRPIPDAQIDAMLRRLKVQQGRGFRVTSARYRISGFRDPDSGQWITRNPRNGNYYRVRDGRHRTQVRPTPEILRRSDMLALEVEIDRGKGPTIYYVSVPQ